MNKYTDLELQIWLAEQLSEDIKQAARYSDENGPFAGTFVWLRGYLERKLQTVTPHEWLHITHEVIKKLTWEQKSKMNDILYDITPEDKCMWENDWQTLAAAYFMTIEKLK